MKIPTHRINGDYIREWLVLGPFFSSDLEADFLADVGGEANINPQEDDTVLTSDGRGLSWKRYLTKGNLINLSEPDEYPPHTTMYAACILQSQTAGDAQIYFGSRGGMAVWINGQRVYSHTIVAMFTLDEYLCEVELKPGANRCLVKIAQQPGDVGLGFAMRAKMLPEARPVISGVITDETGAIIPNASVRLEQNGLEIAKTQTDISGNYRMDVYPVHGGYDLAVTSGEKGDWQLGIRLYESERRTLNFTLKETVSIEGTLLMLDNATPLMAVPVQAIRDGKVIDGMLSDERGKYRFVNLKPGKYQVRCYTLDGYVYYQQSVGDEEMSGNEENEPSLSPHFPRSSFLQVEPGKPLKDIDFRLPHFKKGTWKNYTYLDGLVHNYVNAIHCSPDGRMWFGTWGGVSQYDGKEFVHFPFKDGLACKYVRAIYRDSDGALWFGTEGGVSRYDGKGFVNFTTKEGLAHNRVHTIYRDPDGLMWFGTQEGVSRYDGKGFVNFTTKEGLVHPPVRVIHRAPDGGLWFGTWGGGVSRYDGSGVVNFTTGDGLAGNNICAIDRAPDGVIWFGTRGGGVSRFDGKRFVNFTTKEGLAHDCVGAIYRDPDGVLWFGTSDSFTGGGVSRYDGVKFVNFTTKDGLAHNAVRAICRGPDGALWFGTHGGVSRYDGVEFVNFTTKDGLAYNAVFAIHRDPDDALWFGTGWYVGGVGGISRYDGKEFVNFTTKEGLAHNFVRVIHRDPDGALWFGTWGWVSRYDGVKFINFTTKEGLVANDTLSIYRDSDGILWFGTNGGGVSLYDGIAWMSLDTRDGLASNHVLSIFEDPEGSLWLGTSRGITRYRRSRVPPIAYMVAITTDQRYTDLNALGPVVVGTRITFEYNSIDFKTYPQKRLYRYKLEGYDADWKPPTRETRVDYADLPVGEYTFFVQGIDRDLNYSEPATVRLTVQYDPHDVTVAALQTEIARLQREVGRKYHFPSIVGRSTPIKFIHALMEKAIDSGLTVLISGETGTGKELVAKAIHYNSPRKNKPLLELNCGAVPKDLIASILFGYRKGAFTGATQDSAGLFEAAAGGTVMLDEIGEMSNEAQVHLLRVLQERQVQRLGETRLREIDVRIIAITNKELRAEVEVGRFREEVYHRINVFPIHVPPLRERLDDLPLLAEHFLRKGRRQLSKEIDGFASGVIEMLQSYPWPGNVRELENEIYRAAALVEEGLRIQTYHFSSKITQGESLIQEIISGHISYADSLDRFRRRLIENALRECGGNHTRAAKVLGMSRPNLVTLIKRLGIKSEP